MKTFSYMGCPIEDIEIGRTYYFGQLWDGNGDENIGSEIFDSGSIAVGDNLVKFVCIVDALCLMDCVVEVIEIF